MPSHLKWEVSTSTPAPTAADPPPPGASQRLWPPVSSTLIFGRHEAVLVDTPITIVQATVVADWVARTGRKLSRIYVTHGHGDHWFGAPVILSRFPGAELTATPAVVDEMHRQASGPTFEVWARRFPGQLPPPVTRIQRLQVNSFEIEGEQLIAIPLGHTDMEHTTCLYSPTLGLVAAGDAVYNGVHLLVRGDADARQEWLRALDVIESLHPNVVIAGHKVPERVDTPHTIDETRQYIRDFSAVLDDAHSASDIFDRMIALYPQRLYPGALWASAIEQADRLSTHTRRS
jgi:glyoxylase-like metal-dependent hydrolase (beta-lactamase superfamily II)